MRKLFFLIIVLFFGCILMAPGQDINLNRPMVNELLAQLRDSKADTTKISMLVELGAFHLDKQGEAAYDLDSAFTYLDEAKRLSDSLQSVKWQHNTERLLVIAYMEKGKRLEGRTRFSKLMEDCKKTGDKEGQADAQFKLATWLYGNEAGDETDEILDLHQQALSTYREIKHQEKEIRVLREIAYMHLNQQKLAQAETELLEVLNRYQSIDYSKLHYTYDLLAALNRLKGEYNKGLSYALKCIESMDLTQDTLNAATFYTGLARIYAEVGNHDKSMEWYQKAFLKFREESLPDFKMYFNAGILANELIQQNKAQEAFHLISNLAKEIPPITIIQKAAVAQSLANCYNALDNDHLAEEYYLEALAWYAKLGYEFEETQKVQYYVGKFYLEQEAYTKAAYHLRKALNAVPQTIAPATIKDIHFMLFTIDSVQGDYLSAIDHFRKHKVLEDSIFNVAKSRQIEELQIQYETAKKEQDINLLNERSRLQQARLEQANLARNITFGGILLLLMFVGLLFNRYRLKQRSHQQLQVQQQEIHQKNISLQQLVVEKEWLLKEIHHRVKNNLQTIVSLLESQSSYLEKEGLAAIKSSQHRVYAMSLIHQKLYQRENLRTVNMSVYLPELINYLCDSFDVRHRIRFQWQIDDVELDVSQAIPLGLILNEAVTNSIKYAFPHQDDDRVYISLHNMIHNQIELCIADNGIGLKEDFEHGKGSSFGMKLIQGLTEDIGGLLSITPENGTKITITFSGHPLFQESNESVFSNPLSFQA